MKNERLTELFQYLGLLIDLRNSGYHANAQIAQALTLIIEEFKN